MAEVPRAALLALALVVGCSREGPAELGPEPVRFAAPQLASSVCAAPKAPWDYVGLIADGQSLATGLVPPPTPSNTLSTAQPYGNVRICDAGPDPKFPRGAGGDYAMVPLIEPMRPSVLPGYTSYGYPTNIWPGSEPPTTHAANELSRLWRERGWGDYVVAATNVAINAQPIVNLLKSSPWRSYTAAIEEARIYTALAAEQGKTYGVGAIVFTHGEANAKTAGYREAVVQLYDDFAADLRCATGQARPPVMIASQESAIAGGLEGAPIQLLEASRDRPGRIVVSGPRYPHPTVDGKHLTPVGYWQLGEKYAEVFELVVNEGVDWKPLAPRNATRDDKTIRVTFDVMYPPLAWDASIAEPWPSAGLPAHFGHGFEVRDVSGAQQRITSSDIEPPATVRIELKATPTCPCVVSYATTGVRGQLRDSDGWLGADGQPRPNFAVHSVATVP